MNNLILKRHEYECDNTKQAKMPYFLLLFLVTSCRCRERERERERKRNKNACEKQKVNKKSKLILKFYYQFK